MKTVLKKSFVLLFCLTFAFSPAIATTQVAKAEEFSDYGGEIAVTALNCFGILDKVGSALSSLTDSLFSGGQEVPVGDATTHSKESCLDSIAYTAAKIVLAKLTKSTLNWINSGFQGSPTFVQSPGSFFKSIADEQVSSFTAEIAFDPNRFPFGRLTAQNIVNSIQNQLDYNASVTSGNLLNYDNNPNTPYKERFDNFTQDFLYGGGWDGYLAVTQISNANPFDSYIQSVNKVGPVVNNAKNERDPIQEITQELQQSGGFLALKKCVDPSWYEPESADTSFTRAQAQAQSQNDPNDSDTQAAREWLVTHTCLRFETKTPGTAIAQQMQISLGETQQQLILADELNESISAVFDALLKQLFKSGVASLSGSDSNPGGTNVDTLGGYGNNTADPTISTNSTGGTTESNQWYNQNKNFDLKEAIAPGGVLNDPDCFFNVSQTTGEITNPTAHTDGTCNKGYATIQRMYAQALQVQSNKLQEAVRWINYADYCVPGPRPDWYQPAREAVNSLQQRFADIGQEEDQDDRRRHSYLELKYFTGFAADYSDVVNLRNPSNAFNAIWQTLSEKNGTWGYKQYIENRYDALNPDMPNIALVINQEYSRKAHYSDLVGRNATAAAEAQSMYLRLRNIYENILSAETQFGIGTANPDMDSFKQVMDNQLKVFSRLVSQIRTPDAISNVLADTALAEDEIKYISDPSSGLVAMCIQDTQTVHVMPSYLTRRAYQETKATTADFTKRGWTGGDPLASYVPAQTFLPGVSISTSGVPGHNAPGNPTGAGVYTTGYIHLGSFVNACGGGNIWEIPLDGVATYGGCMDFDPSLPFSTGDRFENHINAY